MKSTTANICKGCGLSLLNCLCKDTPSMECDIEFWILTHGKEFSRPTNTGRLIKNVLQENAFIYEWKRTEAPVGLINKLNSGDYKTYLVFPAENSEIEKRVESFKNEDHKKIAFLLIDGTWQEARKMVRKSPYLSELPILSFEPERKSKFELRRNISDKHLCTIEIAIELLKVANEPEKSKELEIFFDRFIKHYLADKSGHKVKS